MRTPLQYLRQLALRPRGIIHVGASTGQEVSEYADGRLRHALLIEPLDEPFKKLQSAVAGLRHYHPIQALCGDRDGTSVPFHVASNGGESSSILAPDAHLALHPSISFAPPLSMTTTTLDTVRDVFLAAHPAFTTGHFDILTLDVQGAELMVLRGAERTLEDMRAVWCEVAHVELYSGNARFEEVQSYLADRGFRLFYTAINRRFWGNALFIHMDRLREGWREAETKAKERSVAPTSLQRPL